VSPSKTSKPFPPPTMRWKVVSSIRPGFPGLSQSQGQVTHVLLTRSPLIRPASWASSFDLHVLSTPPAFVLSQDQTLRQKNEKTPGHPTTKQDTRTIQADTVTHPTEAERATANQPNKTFGINKHGTLLSSQTTDQEPDPQGPELEERKLLPAREPRSLLQRLNHHTEPVPGVST
jgi:hypothetical protein